MTTSTTFPALVTIQHSFAIDRRSNPNLRWQIRCNSASFNGVLFATRTEAESFAASLMKCGCGLIVREGAPHLSTCKVNL